MKQPTTKRKHPILKLFLTCIIILLAAILLLPTILSCNPVRELILGQVNKNIDGVLTAESWALHWTRRIEINNATFDDQAGTRIRVERVTMPRGLLALLKSTANVGVLAEGLELSGGVPGDISAKGRFLLNGTVKLGIDTADTRIIEVNLSASVDNLEIKTPDKPPFNQDKIKLSVLGTIAPKPGDAPGEAWQTLLRQTTATGNISLSRVESFGITMDKLEAPLAVADSRARITVDTIVNEGKIALAPVIDVSGKTPLLTLPDNSKILSDVKLDDDIANELLALIHPIFKGCTVTSGKLGMTMEKLHVPLDKTVEQETTFNGIISLRNMNMAAGELLKTILDITRQKRTDIAVPDRDIAFKCEKGRISAEPLEIKTGGYSMTLSGSVGLDQTLQYLVDIPITMEMVGSDAYKYLEGETIRIPIGGTISEPDWGNGENVVQSVLKDLVKKASRKIITEEGKKLLETETKKLKEEAKTFLETEAQKLLKDLF